jgi:hypothetical protein
VTKDIESGGKFCVRQVSGPIAEVPAKEKEIHTSKAFETNDQLHHSRGRRPEEIARLL